MKYKEFLDYIYQRHSGNVKLGLERMNSILSAMGDPNLKLYGIHIGGTNGKGSTAAVCEALSIVHGLKPGLNTSPHLVDYRERIRINGNNISFQDLKQIYLKWQPVLEKYEASFFEITTSMAFYHFWQQKVDNAIFEVGLGGRLDGTNPFASTVSVITSISYDHTKTLGNTIAKIAREKAGITKPGVPLVLGKMSSYAVNRIKENTDLKNAPIYVFGNDYSVENISINEKGTTFDYLSTDLNFKDLTVNLLGKHQAVNASTAITAFRIFLQRTGRVLDEFCLRKALKQVNWQGRLQILQQNPLVLIDGAHNTEGIKALVANVSEMFPKRKIRFVLAILRDKNLKQIIHNICSISYKVYISKNKSTRAAEVEVQEKFVQESGIKFEVIHDVVKATEKAISDSSYEDVVVISGSLYTISEVLKVKNKLF
ncbi:bifunctional folylpolyglutamate synthase/dihydrofolate synthase [Candidatus Cloacimonadota bacterium]